ncbi:MAG: ATP-binding protein [Actinomycetota bacterium]|nr:ATP-binding protein [Actinomycetota bacterium]
MNDFTWLAISVVLAGICVILGLRVASERSHRPAAKSTRPSRPRADFDPRSAEWAIIQRMAEGFVVLNDLMQPISANPAARELLGFPEGALPPRLPSDEVRTVARRALGADKGIEEIVSIWFPSRSTLRVRAEALEGRQGVVVVIQDITEQLKTQRIRTEFVAHASHELKSPVASLQTLGEALRHAVRDDPEAADRFAERIVAESARLGRLIGDLLDLSRLEDPEAVPEETVNLSLAARKVVEDSRAEAESKHIELSFEIEDSVLVRGDESQIVVLIRNLMENAIRYTADAGRVSIDVYHDGGAAVIRVSDNGMGIPLEAQGRIFERFYRVDRARSRDRGGTGLGLAIVKHVAELHGGVVQLDSELGRGSIFTARIPAVSPPSERIRTAG